MISRPCLIAFVCAQVYSGYLLVPGPFKGNKYDSLSIHYQFEEAQSDPAKAPVVTWHQVGLLCHGIFLRCLSHRV